MSKIQRHPIRSNIAFLLLCIILGMMITSCASLSVKKKWPYPNPPIKNEVVFLPIEYNGQRGVFISEQDTIDLANNTKEQKRYVEDLEALIRSMINYYKAE